MLPGAVHFSQMLMQAVLSAEGHEEVIGPGLDLALADMILDAFVYHHQLLLLCKLPDLHHQVCRVHHIDDEDAEEHADEEGKCQIPGQPVQHIKDMGMNQEIIHRAQNRPDQRKHRADNSLNIAPQLGVINKRYFL